LAHAMGLASYDQYIGYQCQFTSVDIQACAEAYLKLSEDDALVREMGAAGKEKARRVYDWPVIIKQYEQLWSNLEVIRKSAPEAVARKNGQAAYPLRNDPNIIFSSYPTHVLNRHTTVRPVENTDAERLKKLLTIPMGRYATEFLHSEDDTAKLLEKLSTQDSFTIDSLTSELASQEKKSLILTIMWLTKVGLLELTNKSGDDKPDAELLKATSAIFEQISPAV
jgi:starch synthase